MKQKQIWIAVVVDENKVIFRRACQSKQKGRTNYDTNQFHLLTSSNVTCGTMAKRNTITYLYSQIPARRKKGKVPLRYVRDKRLIS